MTSLFNFPPFMVFKYLAERRRRKVQTGRGGLFSSFLEEKNNSTFEFDSLSLFEKGEPFSYLIMSESTGPH